MSEGPDIGPRWPWQVSNDLDSRALGSGGSLGFRLQPAEDRLDSPLAQELFGDEGVDDAGARTDLAGSGDELVELADPLFEEVSDAGGVPVQKAGRRGCFYVLAQNKHGDIGVDGLDVGSCPQAFISMVKEACGYR